MIKVRKQLTLLGIHQWRLGRLAIVGAHGLRTFTKITTHLRTFLQLVCAQIISSVTTGLRTHFPSHFYRLRTVSEYFNFTGVVKNVFLV